MITETTSGINNVPPLILSTWTKDDYLSQIFTLLTFSIALYDYDLNYETVANNIERYRPAGNQLAYGYNQPGSLLYSLYGTNSIVIYTTDILFLQENEGGPNSNIWTNEGSSIVV